MQNERSKGYGAKDEPRSSLGRDGVRAKPWASPGRFERYPMAEPLGPDSERDGGRPEDVGPHKGAGSQTRMK